MKSDPGKFRVEVDGLPALSFERIEPGLAPATEVAEPTRQDWTTLATRAMDEELRAWYSRVLEAAESYSPAPRGVIVFGVEGWEIGDWESGPKVLSESIFEMVVKLSIHGYCFVCPHCGAGVRPSTAESHGPKMATAVQCPACGVPSLVSALEETR